MTGNMEMFPDRPRIIFMGTPEFAVPALEALIRHEFNVLAVVTQPDRPRGRGQKLAQSPIKRRAIEHGIETIQPEKVSDDGFLGRIREKAPDVIIVAAFGQKLGRELLNLCKWKVLNIHASLLPKYRGAAPIQWAILNNERVTGLSLMRMDEGMDTGPVIFQEEVPISENETGGELHDRLALISGEFIINSLKRLTEEPYREKKQDDSLATYAPKIDRSSALIDWTMDMDKISARIRALDPWPGAFTKIRGNDVKLFSSRKIDEYSLKTVPGRVSISPEGMLCVETGRGFIEVREVQFPGKKRMKSCDFLRGFELPEDSVIGK
ncbi:MAG: methionyl-tRNA formyltransferase [Deltaproteobacteria bacterium]|nr:methionyl-tRNA formyltransferase [Deltaproteobacteria bacterium]